MQEFEVRRVRAAQAVYFFREDIAVQHGSLLILLLLPRF